MSKNFSYAKEQHAIIFLENLGELLLSNQDIKMNYPFFKNEIGLKGYQQLLEHFMRHESEKIVQPLPDMIRYAIFGIYFSFVVASILSF